jgi:hypothetical protein
MSKLKYGRSLQPSKENIQHVKKIKFINFFQFFWVISALLYPDLSGSRDAIESGSNPDLDPDPQDWFPLMLQEGGPDPIQVWIRIHNTGFSTHAGGGSNPRWLQKEPETNRTLSKQDVTTNER